MSDIFNEVIKLLNYQFSFINKTHALLLYFAFYLKREFFDCDILRQKGVIYPNYDLFIKGCLTNDRKKSI